MARFSYLAIDPDGRERRGGMNAADERAVRRALEDKKLYPLAVEHAGNSSASQTGSKSPAKGAGQPKVSSRDALRHKDRMLVTRQLATLVGASVSVDEALGILVSQQESAAARRVLADMRRSIQEGSRLADAMARHKSSFPAAYRAAVAGGERSGNLGPVLNRLALYLQREQGLRSKITTALVYPIALSLVAVTVVACLMVFVVPALVEQFKSFHGDLPLITSILIAVSEGLTRFWPLILLVLAGGFIVIRTLLRQPHLRLAFDGGLLKAPLVGKWIRAVCCSRFVRSVATLNASGLPVLESVRASRDAASNRAFMRAADQMAERIQEGEPLSHAMRQSGYVPPMVVYMAVGGENSGELPGMLEKAADHLDQEFEGFVQTALSLIEPAIIVLMGGMVAGIVLAIMLPILQLNQLAAG
ncbi:MAG: type II secretion system inner membrane protein GspF [Hyphomonadaceae bacterium]